MSVDVEECHYEKLTDDDLADGGGVKCGGGIVDSQNVDGVN